jgi:diguanylate cyclase (GGDEF)-like protein
VRNVPMQCCATDSVLMAGTPVVAAAEEGPVRAGSPARWEAMQAAAETVAGACDGLMDDLRERYPMPSVYLLIDGRLRCQAARGYFQVVDGFPVGTGVIGRVVDTGAAVLKQDVTGDPHFIAAMPGLVSEACVPVWIDGRVVGAVNVESTEPLASDVMSVLTSAAAALAERIQAAGGLPPVSLSQRLARIAVGLSAMTEAADIYPRVIEGALDLSGMDSAALCRRDRDASWSVVHASGSLTPALKNWTHEEYQVIAGWVDAGTSSHFAGDPDDSPPEYEFLLRAGVRAVMVHPLVVGKDVTGLLLTAHTAPAAHDPVVGAALEMLAAQSAACLGMAAALDELARRARQDSLTGAGNGAAFVDELESATRAATGGAGAACLLVDVDYFKLVNDTYGHLAGDRLLRALTEEFASVLRAGDGLFRIGGDEFAILLPSATTADMHAIAARLVQAARRVRTTVSLGAAMIVPGMTPEHVRLRADQALYEAKAAGRDRYACGS